MHIIKKRIPKILLRTKINNIYSEKGRKVLYSDKPVDLKTIVNLNRNNKEE